MSDLITRNFVVDRGGREVIYPFTTFSSIFRENEESENIKKLFAYLRKVFLEGVPEIEGAASISQMPELLLECERRTSELTELASMANYQGEKFGQHNIVQQYFLRNDPCTIATEIPVWDEKDKVSGHIDFLRILDNGKIQLPDFKPKAAAEKKALSQVFRYRVYFSRCTGIHLKDIEASYFDDCNAYFLIS